MFFTCKGKEKIATLIERVYFEAGTVKLTLDLHSEHVTSEVGDNVDFEFDDSLQYACNVTTVSMDENGLLGSCGGLLFLWTGSRIPISKYEQFTFSLAKSVQAYSQKTDGQRYSKRIRGSKV